MTVVAVDGGTGAVPIKIEVAGGPDDAMAGVYGDEAVRGVAEKVVKLARPLFAEAIDLVRACADQVADKLEEMPADKRPDEMELQFAVRLDAKLGASIVGTEGGAQLQVSLKWNTKSDG